MDSSRIWGRGSSSTIHRKNLFSPHRYSDQFMKQRCYSESLFITTSRKYWILRETHLYHSLIFQGKKNPELACLKILWNLIYFSVNLQSKCHWQVNFKYNSCFVCVWKKSQGTIFCVCDKRLNKNPPETFWLELRDFNVKWKLNVKGFHFYHRIKSTTRKNIFPFAESSND